MACSADEDTTTRHWLRWTRSRQYFCDVGTPIGNYNPLPARLPNSQYSCHSITLIRKSCSLRFQRAHTVKRISMAVENGTVGLLFPGPSSLGLLVISDVLIVHSLLYRQAFRQLHLDTCSASFSPASARYPPTNPSLCPAFHPGEDTCYMVFQAVPGKWSLVHALRSITAGCNFPEILLMWRLCGTSCHYTAE